MAQAGVPVALSKLIAENNQLGRRDSGRKVFVYAFCLLTVVGLASAVLMALLSGVIARMQGNPDTTAAFVVVAPALLFVPVTNVLKGYFQGNMNMVPSGVTSVIEQLVKLAVGLTLAYRGMPDVNKAVMGAVWAITVSEFGSLVIMSVVYLVHKKRNRIQNLQLKKGRCDGDYQASICTCRTRCAWRICNATKSSH